MQIDWANYAAREAGKFVTARSKDSFMRAVKFHLDIIVHFGKISDVEKANPLETADHSAAWNVAKGFAVCAIQARDAIRAVEPTADIVGVIRHGDPLYFDFTAGDRTYKVLMQTVPQVVKLTN